MAPGRLLGHEGDDRVFDLGGDAVLQIGLAPADLHQGRLAAGLAKIPEAAERVSAVAHDLARLADIAHLLGQLKDPDLGLDDLAAPRFPWSTSYGYPGGFADCPIKFRLSRISDTNNIYRERVIIAPSCAEST